jgi:hypothetical protein
MTLAVDHLEPEKRFKHDKNCMWPKGDDEKADGCSDDVKTGVLKVDVLFKFGGGDIEVKGQKIPIPKVELPVTFPKTYDISAGSGSPI